MNRMVLTTGRCYGLLALCLLASLWASDGFATSLVRHDGSTVPSRGLTVMGLGTVKAKPTSVAMVATVDGKAQLAGDAYRKFRDARRRVVETFEKLGIANLSINGNGLRIVHGRDQAEMEMGDGEMVKERFVFTEQLRVVITEIDKLAHEQLIDQLVRLMDTAKDMSLKLGVSMYSDPWQYDYDEEQTTLFLFRVANPTALHARAQQRAVEDTKAKATLLARQAGVKVGALVAVSEASSLAGGWYPMQLESLMYGDASSNAQTPAVVTDRLIDVPLRVVVTATFEIGIPAKK